MNLRDRVRAEAERDAAFLDAFKRLQESVHTVPFAYPQVTLPRFDWWKAPTPWRVSHNPCTHRDCRDYRDRYLADRDPALYDFVLKLRFTSGKGS